MYFSALRKETDLKIKDFGPKVEENFLNSAYEREHIYVWSCVPQKILSKTKTCCTNSESWIPNGTM